MKYVVLVTETLTREIIVTAVSKDSAREIAARWYKREELALSHNDWKGTTFEVVG